MEQQSNARSMPEAGTIGDLLHIPRSNAWAETQIENCQRLFEEYSGALASYQVTLAHRGGFLPLLIATNTTGLDKALNNLLKAFFIVGYMKGVQTTEDNQRWDNLIRKE